MVAASYPCLSLRVGRESLPSCLQGSCSPVLLSQQGLGVGGRSGARVPCSGLQTGSTLVGGNSPKDTHTHTHTDCYPALSHDLCGYTHPTLICSSFPVPRSPQASVGFLLQSPL